MNNKVAPRILSGFMELMPNEQIAFNKILDTIKSTYESFGFTPLDTPVLELSEVLLAKAGGETEKQIYRFLKGDTDISMRFDLTVPLARFVSMHSGELAFPFKRYQIDKVYRGERSQKGRFREFYQCDIDVIGMDSLDISYDAEMPAIIYNLFCKLGLKDFTINLNNRKILKGFFTSLGLQDNISDILRVIDKLDKMGVEKIKAELKEQGITDEIIAQIISFISIKGTSEEQISALKEMNITNEIFVNGVEELAQVVAMTSYLGVPKENITVNLSIARGLDYYTGTIYETTLTNYPEIGSICSGGRYDDLANFYTDKKLPGVGISIGLTRLFSQLNSADLLKEQPSTPALAVIIPISENEEEAALKFATLLRQNGIKILSFTERNKKFKAKLQFANRIKAPFAAIFGENEVLKGTVVIKDMLSGEQQTLLLNDAIELLSTKSCELDKELILK